MKKWSVLRGFEKAESAVFQRRTWLLAAASLLLAACAAAPAVGSYDCKVIAGVLPNDPYYDTCKHCQGRSCSHMDCRGFPCSDERRTVQVCQTDADCKDLLAAHCGKGEAHGVCTLNAQ